MIFSESLEAHRQSFVEAMRVRNYSKATIKLRAGSLALFFRYLASIGVNDAREVSRQTMRAYQAWLMTQRYTMQSVHVHLSAVRRFFEHLEKSDAILLNPCNGVPLHHFNRPLPRNVLTLKEASAVLDAPDTQTKAGIRDKAMLELFYSTGIRVGEMAQLSVHDADTRHAMLRVTRGKGARDRVVPMGKKACGYVKEYLEEVRSQWCKRNPESLRGGRNLRDERALWLASSAPFAPFKRDGIEQMVSRYGIKAGLSKSLTPHAWRHTCATHLVAAGANIAHVQRLLGHRSLETTQIYTRVALPEVKKTFKRSHPRA